MKTKHETSNSQVAEVILSDRSLRAKEQVSQRDDLTAREGTICNKSKLGYNGAAKVDSDSLNQTGDVMMSNNIEVIQAQVDSNEKKLDAGLAGHKAELAGHKAELEGHKAQVEGNFAAVFARMDADREVSLVKHEATLKRMDADRKAMDAENKAIRERADADRKATNERMDAAREVSDAKFWAHLKRMDADRKVAKANHKIAMDRMDTNYRNLEDKIVASLTTFKLWGIVTIISVVAVGFAIVRSLSGGL